MNKKLLNIRGLSIPNFPLELTKIGDLVYFEGSLMSVYSDNYKNSFIFDWVESNHEVNRWLVYEVEKSSLSNYIFNSIPHYNLINSPVNDLIFMVDIGPKNDVINCKITSPKNIPYKYLPKTDVVFDEEDSINLDRIINYFQLENIELLNTNDYTFDILEEARKNDSELINLHIKSKDSKVGFGKIRTSILGEVLVNYHKLNNATALSIYDEKGKLPKDEKIRRKKGELKEIKELAETEFVYAKAASFSVFLKPIKQRYELFSEKTTSEVISTSIFNLFTASEELGNLEKIKSTLSDDVLNSFQGLLKEVKENNISLSIQYANPVNEVKLSEKFDTIKATRILKNLDVLEINDSNDFKIEGVFKALDLTNYSFKFEDNEGETYYGKFSPQLQMGMHTFNLQSYYKSVITVQEIKDSGKTQMKEKVIMVSCVKTESSTSR